LTTMSISAPPLVEIEWRKGGKRHATRGTK
jgi:hypothetical protein